MHKYWMFYGLLSNLERVISGRNKMYVFLPQVKFLITTYKHILPGWKVGQGGLGVHRGLNRHTPWGVLDGLMLIIGS